MSISNSNIPENLITRDSMRNFCGWGVAKSWVSFWRIHSLDIDIISVEMSSLYLIVFTWFKRWPRLRLRCASSIIYEVVLRERGQAANAFVLRRHAASWKLQIIRTLNQRLGPVGFSSTHTHLHLYTSVNTVSLSELFVIRSRCQLPSPTFLNHVVPVDAGASKKTKQRVRSPS